MFLYSTQNQSVWWQIPQMIGISHVIVQLFKNLVPTYQKRFEGVEIIAYLVHAHGGGRVRHK